MESIPEAIDLSLFRRTVAPDQTFGGGEADPEMFGDYPTDDLLWWHP